MKIVDLFRIDHSPRKGLLAAEWVMLAYLALTLVVVLFTYTKVTNPQAMLWGRFRILAITLALWGVYRAVPCRLTLLARVAVQLALLVSRYIRTQPHVSQPRPLVCLVRANTLWLPARLALQQTAAVGRGERAYGYGVLHVLSHDRIGSTILLLLQVQ